MAKNQYLVESKHKSGLPVSLNPSSFFLNTFTRLEFNFPKTYLLPAPSENCTVQKNASRTHFLWSILVQSTNTWSILFSHFYRYFRLRKLVTPYYLINDITWTAVKRSYQNCTTEFRWTENTKLSKWKLFHWHFCHTLRSLVYSEWHIQ